MKITLSPELEAALLRAIMEGWTSTASVDEEELSKPGRAVFRAIRKFPGRSPTYAALLLAATKIFGADREEVKRLLEAIKAINIKGEAGVLVKAIQDKQSLVEVINEAGEQLSTGALSLSKIAGLIRRHTSHDEKIIPMADTVGKFFPHPPSGLKIESLPLISAATAGFMGLWILGGEPGLGKSTIAWQIALEIQQKMPVLYYDIDGTGMEWFRERTRLIVGGSIKKFKAMTGNIHVRDYIRTLEDDLLKFNPPASVFIDSVQKLPTKIEFRRTSIDNWIVNFQDVAKRGYTIFLVSEKSRASYGQVGMGAFKESGELEYAATIGAQLSRDPEDPEAPIEFHIVKNRHGPRHGLITLLDRDKKKIFWFNELDQIEGEDFAD